MLANRTGQTQKKGFVLPWRERRAPGTFLIRGESYVHNFIEEICQILKLVFSIPVFWERKMGCNGWKESALGGSFLGLLKAWSSAWLFHLLAPAVHTCVYSPLATWGKRSRKPGVRKWSMCCFVSPSCGPSSLSNRDDFLPDSQTRNLTHSRCFSQSISNSCGLCLKNMSGHSSFACPLASLTSILY